MKLDKELVLQKKFLDIQCEPGCNNCCGDCDRLDDNNLCSVYPTRVDPETVFKRRGMKCHSSPWQLFISSHYCPPIVREFEAVTGHKVKGFRTKSGEKTISNFSEIRPGIHEIYEITKGGKGRSWNPVHFIGRLKSRKR